MVNSVKTHVDAKFPQVQQFVRYRAFVPTRFRAAKTELPLL